MDDKPNQEMIFVPRGLDPMTFGEGYKYGMQVERDRIDARDRITIAAAALTGILMHSYSRLTVEQAVEECLRYADAMLERKNA